MEKVKSEEKKRCRNVSCGTRLRGLREKNMKNRNYSISYCSKLSGEWYRTSITLPLSPERGNITHAMIKLPPLHSTQERGQAMEKVGVKRKTRDSMYRLSAHSVNVNFGLFRRRKGLG